MPEGLYAKGAPAESIDPGTLAARVKGCKMQRSEGGQASTARRAVSRCRCDRRSSRLRYGWSLCASSPTSSL
ncbi:DUF6009 family protein [Streptomyces flaveolus]|uniref:DUF6009 family protein n=1 Tax=Streptomyces flaveolus TaxID=67297 RepID=UPI00382485B7